jgi:hypothetical protein
MDIIGVLACLVKAANTGAASPGRSSRGHVGSQRGDLSLPRVQQLASGAVS